MKILKELQTPQIEDLIYESESEVGVFIDKLRSLLEKEELFLEAISSLKSWNHDKISLWILESILNYIDQLLSKYKENTSEFKTQIIIILKFLKIVIQNLNNKDIFASFDSLSEIFKETSCFSTKILIIEIYLSFQTLGVKKSLVDNYVEFCFEIYLFVVELRPIFVDFLLKKYQTIDSFRFDIEKSLTFSVLKDQKKDDLEIKMKDYIMNESKLSEFVEQYSYLKKDTKTVNLYYSLYNFFLLVNFFSNGNYEEMKISISFVVNMINLIIFANKRKKTIQMISEYYIEKYLKDVLEILTSNNDIELKGNILQSTIGFVTFFDGYESILFQNGLFHSILSDLTNPKFEETDLQILSYPESVNQDFFNTILLFLYKTSSFREIPIHFLNKVLELPKDNVYPYRIDNVIFSLKKKRIIDETALNDLVIPRLTFEIENYHIKDEDLRYLYDPLKKPTKFERTGLIIKLLKILISIFERTTNSQNLRTYIESRLLDVIVKIFNDIEKDIEKMKIFDPIFTSLVDFISKLCNFLPSKVPVLIENNALPAIIQILKHNIPERNDVLNSIFSFIYSIHMKEEGEILVRNHCKPVIENLVERIFDEKYLSANIFCVLNLFKENYYSPYTFFLRMENQTEIIQLFFLRILEKIKQLKVKLDTILLEKEHENTFKRILNDETYAYLYSYYISTITQFFINISQEEREILSKDKTVNLEEIILCYYNLALHPIILYSLNTTGPITSSIIKSVFSNNPDRLYLHILKVLSETIKIIYVKSGIDLQIPQLSISRYQEDAIEVDQEFILTDKHIDRILGKLVFIIEITVRKLIFFMTKIDLEKIISIMSIIMTYLVRRQSNINMYMSPVNSCILVINQNCYFKFLSNCLSPNVRAFLTSENFKHHNPKVKIFSEKNFFDENLHFQQSFDSNMRVEIVESSNMFSTDVLDIECKKLINSHMPILDFFISLGKITKKKTKEIVNSGDLLMTNWKTISKYILTILNNLNTEEDWEFINQLDFSKKDDLLKVINILIYYINTLNNTNIIILDRNMSGYIFYLFYLNGGIDKFMAIIDFLLNISEKASKINKHPILFLLLIKNMWNIIISFFLKVHKMNFDSVLHFSVISTISGYKSNNDFLSAFKLSILNSLVDRFLKPGSLSRISNLSHSFHSLIFMLIDSCVIQYRNMSKSTNEEKTVRDLVSLGFSRINIILAMQENITSANDIAEFLLHNQDLEKNIIDFFKGGQNANEEIKEIDSNEISKGFLKKFEEIYKYLIEDELNTNKIQQIRKMNLIFRIKDILLNSNTLMIQFIREIMTKENQVKDQKEDEIESNFSDLNKILQNRMLINYIIVKDRSKASNIFESLNIDETAKFFKEFDLISTNFYTIKHVLNQINKNQNSNKHKQIIYESLFMIYLCFHFVTFYHKSKHFEKVKEGSNLEKDDFQFFDMSRFKIEYLETFANLIETQNKNDKNILIDEQNLTLCFLTISENFDSNDNFKIFTERGIFKSILKIKRTLNFESINDTKFKFKVVFDEAYRMFFFKIFEDSKNYEGLVESLIKYVFANYYDSSQISSEQESDRDELGKEKNKEGNEKEKDNENDKININNNNISKEELSNHQKSLETAATHTLNLEFSLATFIKIMFPIIIKNREVFLKVLQKMAIVDKKLIDIVKETDTDKKKKKHKLNKKENIVIKLLPEFSNDVMLIYKEMKTNDIVLDRNEKSKEKEPNQQNTQSKSKSKDKVKREQIENQIEKIFKQFNSNKVKLINNVVKHIWDLTVELKTKIDDNLKNKKYEQVKHDYMFGIDTLLISLSNIIHAYPSVISIILKYHGNNPDDSKKPMSFVSFLVRKVFYVLNFYNFCDKPESIKEAGSSVTRELIYFGFEPNSQPSIFEAFRTHNIISHLILSLCYKRRIMNPNEIFLVNKSRKKVLKEIDQMLVNVVNSKTASYLTETKVLLEFKIVSYVLYNFTLFHENSHIYSNNNCFEILKLILSKDYSIIKNLVEIMKSIDIKDLFAFHIHKLAVITLSEMTKLLNTTNKKDGLKSGKVFLNNLKFNENIECFIQSLPARNDSALFAEDNANSFNENEENEEGVEISDSNEDDEMNDDNEEDYYYSLTNSENDDEEDEFDEAEEDEMYENDDDENSQSNQSINNEAIQQPEIQEEEKISEEDEDEDEMEQDEEFDEEEESGEENNENNNFDEIEDEENQNQLDYDNYYNVRDHTVSDEGSEDFNDDAEDLDRFYNRPRNRDLFNVFENYNNFQGVNLSNYLNLRRDNHVNIIYGNINNNNVEENFDNYMDEILFINPTLDKTMKNDNNLYFEDNICFPFMLFPLNDDIGEFYRPEVYISLIHKVKKNQIYYLNVMFQFKYMCPFDKKMRKNLVFAVNGKEKISNTYLKDLQKLEADFTSYSNEELLKPYISKLDSYEMLQSEILKNYNIKIDDVKHEIKEEEKSRSPKNEALTLILNKEEVKTNLNENEFEMNNNIEMIEEEQKAEKIDVDMVVEETKEQQKQETAKSNTNDNFMHEIDPQFLEQLPEDIAMEIIQQHRQIVNNNTSNRNNNLNQLYDMANIDQDILNELPEDIVNEIMNQNNRTASIQVNSNALDHTAFFESLPHDIREELLLNAQPDFLNSLPPDLMAEAQMLIERENSRRHLISRERRPDVHINIEGVDSIFKNSKHEFNFSPPKYSFEECLNQQKNTKELSSAFSNMLDDEFLENIITFNIKYTCEFAPKSKISTNPNWLLISNLMQKSNIRYKILDILFMIWILDAICLKELLKMNPDAIQQNPLLKNLHSIFIESKLTEEFFYDDFDQFVKSFCANFNQEMKKFFLMTFLNEKGEFLRKEGAGESKTKTQKKYTCTKNTGLIKELLKISYEKDENVLSNLIRIMLNHSKSDIKKIFSLKIFTNIITSCLRNDPNSASSKIKLPKNLNLSKKTLEIIVDLFYNFETILQLKKERKSNNPTQLLTEIVKDHKCFKKLLDVLLVHNRKLNENVSFNLENFFKNKKMNISEYSKPLPENVLFKIIKLVNKMYLANFLEKPIEEEKNDVVMEVDGEGLEELAIQEEGVNNNINLNNNEPPSNKKSVKKNKSQQNIIEKNKTAISNFIQNFNQELLNCWEKLDCLLFEISKIMKEDQKIIDPKLNRLIPYIEAFILLSNLHFLPEKPNSIQKYVIEKIYKRSPKLSPDLTLGKQFNEQSFNDFFLRFCDKNKKIINLILRRYPKMFPNEILIKISKFLDLENKKKYFKYEIKKLAAEKPGSTINLQIRRNYIFEDSYHQLKDRKVEDLRSKIVIKFLCEEAVDAGGVKREWFSLLAKEIFNPNLGLFLLSANGVTFLPNSQSHEAHSDHLELFKFIGRVISKAVFDGFLLDCHFTRSFYKLILNQPLNYQDMEDYDPEFYKNLKWLLETDISEMGDFCTFSYETDKFGEIEVKELIENGRNIQVTEANKFEYVQKLCISKLYEAIKPQIEAFNSGFYEIIPQKLISIFDHRDLELVISGLPTIDVIDWKNNTIYENYTSESQVILWFWEIVEAFDNDDRAEFLQFVTGSSKVPLEGFSSLSGIGGINKFKISKAFDKNFDRLPSAHTCTNQLDLLEYPSKEVLFERLQMAMKEGKTFGFI